MLCFSFVCLYLVYLIVLVSLDGSFLITRSVFSNVYLQLCNETEIYNLVHMMHSDVQHILCCVLFFFGLSIFDCLFSILEHLFITV